MPRTKRMPVPVADDAADIPVDSRRKMYVRICPKLRAQFKAVAYLAGETSEGCLLRLIREHVQENRGALRKSTASN